MSAKIMGQVYDLELPANEQGVLLALADHADHDGENVFPSNGLIAWKIGCSEDTVSRIKKKLEQRGILITVKAQQGRSKLHRLNLSAGIKKKPYKSDNPPQLAGGRNLPPPANGTVHPPQSFAGTPPAELCGTNHHVTVIEPSVTAPSAETISEDIESIEPAEPKSDRQKGDARFQPFVDAWHNNYPDYFEKPYTFDGGRDGKALKVFLSANKESVDDLMAVAKSAWARQDIFKCDNATMLHSFCRWYNAICANLQTARALPSQRQQPRKRYDQPDGVC
ncbi:MAG: helix-turn-helix domain-containing protein [Patescibacteria group bacterium]|nr:helix-turn-helix domain-containing protein [Patescibacteria group bacterium]